MTASYGVALLSIDGKVAATGYERPVGPWLWQVSIAPDGRLALFGITGRKVTGEGGIGVGAFPEATAFSADARYVYA